MKDVNHYPYQSLQNCSVDQRGRSKKQTKIALCTPIYLDLAEAKSCRDLYLDIGARYAEMLQSTHIFRYQSKVKAS